MLPKKLIDFALLFHQAVNKGLLLFSSTIFALIIANSQFSDIYHHIIETKFSLSFGDESFSLSIHHWVNEFLMSLFFLVVGMEIKREMIEGHLMTREQRIMPVIAACFGVICPVLIYIAFNYKDNIAMKSWAIPAATDIAFALGVFAIFGKNLPIVLRVFLAALAIIDDLIAVIIIALFYSGNLELGYFIPIIMCCLLLYLLNKSNISSLVPYIIIGLFLWYFFFQSGIHSTISGVLLGMFVPLKIKGNSCLLKKLEKYLAPYVAYIILPLFAFSNSGVKLTDVNLEMLLNPVVMGIVVGLFVGKTVGISASVYFMRFFKIISFPKGVKMKHYLSIAALCGIGFTMSLFIALIGFDGNPEHLRLAKLGVLLGSLLSSIVAIIMMKMTKD